MEFESVADRLISEAMDRGDFDDLNGAWKPIPDLDKPYDPQWWLKSFLERERSSEAAVASRDAISAKLGAVWELASESTVRSRVRQLNDQVTELNHVSGNQFALFDVEDVILAWRQLSRARFRRHSDR